MEDDPIRQPMHGESRNILIPSTVLLFVVLIMVVGLFFWTFKNYSSTTTDEVARVDTTPVVVETPEILPRAHNTLLEKIEKHVELPKDEVPEVSTVNDPEVLKASQPFFSNVASGDVLVVFSDFAVIYREDNDVIVNSGNVDNGGDVDFVKISEESLVETDAPGADTTVEIRNGTTITGHASKTKDALVILAYSINGIGNASKNTYDETIVVRKSNVTGVSVKALEELYETTATTILPDGEVETSADILIILGRDE